MTSKFMSMIEAIRAELAAGADGDEKIGLLARALRWQPGLSGTDLEALLALGASVQGQRGGGYWEVERAVYEILSDLAAPEHMPFLVEAYELRGTHAEDRRRLALQGLSRIAALTGDETALRTLASALDHNRADTRGWAIGFLAEAYFALQRPFPDAVRNRLRELAEDDPSEDVRAEAAGLIASRTLKGGR